MKIYTSLEQGIHFLTRKHTSIPTQELKGECAWQAKEIGSPETFAHHLSLAEINAIDTLVDEVEAVDIRLDEIGPGDWGNINLQSLVDECCTALFKGRGFILIRGIPIERWSIARAKLFMAIFGSQFGHLGVQNPQNDIIGEVCNHPEANINYARNYLTNREFRPHCDGADLLGLLTIRPAAQGGQSRLTSSVSVFNALRSESPHLIHRLFEPVLLDLRNEQAPGTPPVVWITPCAHHEGQLKTVYLSDYFRSADRHPGVTIDPEAKILFDLYDRLATHPDLELRFTLEAGDLLIINNHVILHARDAFVDVPHAKRLLLRFLVSSNR